MESGAQRAVHRSSAAPPPPDPSNLLLWDPLPRFPQAGCSSSSCKIAPCNKSGGRQPPFSCPLPCAHPGAHPARSAPPRSPLPVRGHLQPSGGSLPFLFSPSHSPSPSFSLFHFPSSSPPSPGTPCAPRRPHLRSSPLRAPAPSALKSRPPRSAPLRSAPLRPAPHLSAPPRPAGPGAGRGPRVNAPPPAARLRVASAGEPRGSPPAATRGPGGAVRGRAGPGDAGGCGGMRCGAVGWGGMGCRGMR